MNIYAIRDRMIQYYQRPFIADDDKQVLAALAQTINGGDKTNAIAQAPHHFELWKIGTFDQDINVHHDKELITTLDSLVRGNLRETGQQPGGEMETTAPTSQAVPGRTGTHTVPKHTAPSAPAQTTHRTV